jgi:hypothetical protein
MARMLWKPATEIDGVPFQDLCSFVSQLNDWRDQYLQLVGVPNNFQAEWDFVSAVSACVLFFSFYPSCNFTLSQVLAMPPTM